MGSNARGRWRGERCQVFKSILIVVLVANVIEVSSLPQLGFQWLNFLINLLQVFSGNVQFPSTTPRSIFPNQNGIVPSKNVQLLNPNTDRAPYETPVTNEFQVGTTGIACDQPGTFVQAPDGCNRCFCAENRQLSSACSRVFCPPGFPSSTQTRQQYRQRR